MARDGDAAGAVRTFGRGAALEPRGRHGGRFAIEGKQADALREYLAKRKVPGFVGSQTSSCPPIICDKFGLGQSNPTYLVTQGNARCVLRRKPPGNLLPSAHAVEREYHFQRAIGRRLPVPSMHALCEDKSVIGSSFYVMQHVSGIIFRDPKLLSCTPPQRRRRYVELARQLANLHSIDAAKLDLPPEMKRAKRAGAQPYGLRTLRRWRKQYLSSCSACREDPLENMVRLSQMLESYTPQDGGGTLASLGSRPCVIHGDFRLDNIIYGEDSGDVLAVLDWELATCDTLDQGLADVAYACIPYYFPPSIGNIGALTQKMEGGGIAVALPEGIPTVEDFVNIYWKALRANLAPSHPQGFRDTHRGKAFTDGLEWKWFVGLALFRIAAILAGVGARARAGNASAMDAQIVGSREVVSMIADRAIEVLGKDFQFQVLRSKVADFVRKHISPNEAALAKHMESRDKWKVHPLVHELKKRAKKEGLWNLFLTREMAKQARQLLTDGGVELSEEEWSTLLGCQLSHRQYIEVAEVMGWSPFASEVFNCSAPDTGNMEVFIRFGRPNHCAKWLLPLLRGEIRSCFGMTEPKVASSDATNICSLIERRGSNVVLTGRKWWTTGALHPQCKVCLFLGKDGTKDGQHEKSGNHKRHTIVIVPMDARGITVLRPLDVMGFQDAPHGHGEVDFSGVVVPQDNVILGHGRGFEVAQSRLGPGRLHHCARAIGMSERAIDLAVTRAKTRQTFGSAIVMHGGFTQKLATVRLAVDGARLFVHKAASMLDEGEDSQEGGNSNPTRFRSVRTALAEAKVFVPSVTLDAVDFAMQVHGGAGLSSSFSILPLMWAALRSLRIADGPDEVHLETIAKLELKSKL